MTQQLECLDVLIIFEDLNKRTLVGVRPDS